MCEEFMKSERKHYDDEFHDLHEDARRLLAIFDETHHKCTGSLLKLVKVKDEEIRRSQENRGVVPDSLFLDKMQIENDIKQTGTKKDQFICFLTRLNKKMKEKQGVNQSIKSLLLGLEAQIISQSQQLSEKIHMEMSSHFELTRKRISELLEENKSYSYLTEPRTQSEKLRCSGDFISTLDLPLHGLEYSLNLFDQQITMKFNSIDQKLSEEKNAVHLVEEKLLQLKQQTAAFLEGSKGTFANYSSDLSFGGGKTLQSLKFLIEECISINTERSQSLQDLSKEVETTEPLVAKVMERCRAHCKTLQEGISKVADETTLRTARSNGLMSSRRGTSACPASYDQQTEDVRIPYLSKRNSEMEGKSSISPMRRSSGLPSARATDGGYVEENDDITCKVSGIIAICQNFLASSGKLRPFISSHGLSIPEKLIISFDDDYNDLSRLVNSLEKTIGESALKKKLSYTSAKKTPRRLSHKDENHLISSSPYRETVKTLSLKKLPDNIYNRETPSRLPLKDLNNDAACKGLSETSAELLEGGCEELPPTERFISEELRKLKEETRRLSQELEQYRSAFERSKEENKALERIRKVQEEQHNNDKQMWLLDAQKFHEDKVKLAKLAKKFEKKWNEELARNEELSRLLENNKRDFLQMACLSPIANDGMLASRKLEAEQIQTFTLGDRLAPLEEAERGLQELIDQSVTLTNEIKQTSLLAEKLGGIIEQLLAVEKKKDKIHSLLLQSKKLPKQKKKELKTIIQTLDEAKIDTIEKIKALALSKVVPKDDTDMLKEKLNSVEVENEALRGEVSKKSEEVAQLNQKIKNLLKTRDDVIETISQLKVQKDKIEKKYNDEIEKYKNKIAELEQNQNKITGEELQNEFLLHAISKVDEICKVIGEEKLENLLDKKLGYIKSKISEYELQLQEKDQLIEQMKAAQLNKEQRQLSDSVGSNDLYNERKEKLKRILKENEELKKIKVQFDELSQASLALKEEIEKYEMQLAESAKNYQLLEEKLRLIEDEKSKCKESNIDLIQTCNLKDQEINHLKQKLREEEIKFQSVYNYKEVLLAESKNHIQTEEKIALLEKQLQEKTQEIDELRSERLQFCETARADDRIKTCDIKSSPQKSPLTEKENIEPLSSSRGLSDVQLKKIGALETFELLKLFERENIELKDRMTKAELEAQERIWAAEAESYRNQEMLKQTMESFNEKIAALEEEKDALMREIDSLKSEIEELNSRHYAQMGQLEKKQKDEINRVKSEIQDLNAMHYVQTEQLERKSKEEIQGLKEELARKEKELRNVKLSRESLQTQINDVEGLLEVVEKDNKKLRKELLEKRNENITLSSELLDLQEKTATSEQERTKLITERDELKKKIEAKNLEDLDTQQSLIVCKEELNTLKAKLNQCEVLLNEYEEKTEAQGKIIEETRSELERSLQKIALQKEELTLKEELISEKSGEIEALLMKINHLTDEMGQLKGLYDLQLFEVQSLKEDLEKRNQKIAAQGEEILNLQTLNEDQSVKLEEQEGCLKIHLKKISEQEDLLAKQEKILTTQRAQVASLQQQIQSQSDKLAARENEMQILAAKEDEISQLKLTITEKEGAITQLKLTLAKKEEESNQLTLSLSAHEETITQLKLTLTKKEEESDQLKLSLSAHEDTITQLKQNLATQAEKLDQLELAFATKETELNTLSLEIANKRTEEIEAKQKMNELESEYARLKEIQAEDIQKISTLTQELDEIKAIRQAEIEKIETEKTIKEEERARQIDHAMEAKFKELEELLSETQQKSEQLQLKSELLQLELNEANSHVEALQHQVEALQQQVANQTPKEKELRKVLEDLREESLRKEQEFQENLLSMDKQLSSLSEKKHKLAKELKATKEQLQKANEEVSRLGIVKTALSLKHDAALASQRGFYEEKLAELAKAKKSSKHSEEESLKIRLIALEEQFNQREKHIADLETENKEYEQQMHQMTENFRMHVTSLEEACENKEKTLSAFLKDLKAELSAILIAQLGERTFKLEQESTESCLKALRKVREILKKNKVSKIDEVLLLPEERDAESLRVKLVALEKERTERLMNWKIFCESIESKLNGVLDFTAGNKQMEVLTNLTGLDEKEMQNYIITTLEELSKTKKSKHNVSLKLPEANSHHHNETSVHHTQEDEKSDIHTETREFRNSQDDDADSWVEATTERRISRTEFKKLQIENEKFREDNLKLISEIKNTSAICAQLLAREKQLASEIIELRGQALADKTWHEKVHVKQIFIKFMESLIEGKKDLMQILLLIFSLLDFQENEKTAMLKDIKDNSKKSAVGKLFSN